MTDKTFHVAQSIGARKRQEDDFGFSARGDAPEPYLVVIADGMGGHAGGDVASRLAVRHFIEAYEQAGDGGVPERLRAALEAANGAILRMTVEKPDLEGMGATLVAVVRETEGLFYISVGDSPLWRINRHGLDRINADHSMRAVLARQVDDGKLSEEKFASHPQRNQLLSALGDEELDLVDCPEIPIDLASGELLLIATDGIETLPPDEIERIVIAARGHCTASVTALLDAVAKAGKPKQDNTTIAIWRPMSSPAASQEKGKAKRRLPLLAGSLALVAVLSVIGIGAWQLGALGWLQRPAKPGLADSTPGKRNRDPAAGQNRAMATPVPAPTAQPPAPQAASTMTPETAAVPASPPVPRNSPGATTPPIPTPSAPAPKPTVAPTPTPTPTPTAAPPKAGAAQGDQPKDAAEKKDGK